MQVVLVHTLWTGTRTTTYLHKLSRIPFYKANSYSLLTFNHDHFWRLLMQVCNSTFLKISLVGSLFNGFYYLVHDSLFSRLDGEIVSNSKRTCNIFNNNNCTHGLKNKYLPNLDRSYILYYFGTKKVNLKQALIKLGHCKLLNYQTRLNKSIRSAVQYSFQTMLHSRCQRIKPKFSLNSKILF